MYIYIKSYSFLLAELNALAKENSKRSDYLDTSVRHVVLVSKNSAYRLAGEHDWRLVKFESPQCNHFLKERKVQTLNTPAPVCICICIRKHSLNKCH